MPSLSIRPVSTTLRWVKILNLPLAGLQEVEIINTDNSSSLDWGE